MNVKNKEEFARWLVEQANENLALLDGTTGPIKRLFKADVVIGVWQSPSEDFGVGYLVLKGGKLLMETIASGQEITASFATVPCQCYEQAIAAKEVFGTRETTRKGVGGGICPIRERGGGPWLVRGGEIMNEYEDGVTERWRN